MITIASLPRISVKKKKRLGRGLGSGVGAKATRGTKRHQAAREKIALGFEGGQGRITKKFPLLRGKARNKPQSSSFITITTAKLNTLKKESTVDLITLLEAKLVSRSAKRRGVKVVSGGDLQVALKVTLPTTKSARKIIEAAGGTVNL